jgi:methionyl-tRNA formyltransferase
VLGADAGGIRVAAGAGALSITQLQWAGGTPLDARQAVAGRSLAGRRFG